jgi:hypothetical protein
MSLLSTKQRTYAIVVAFAVAMAWVESACVYYLRVLTNRLDPYQADPLPLQGLLGHVELAREMATLVMLIAIGALAAHTWRKRLAYALIAFGTWDIFYYVFLRVISAWPTSPFDWDILFLLPLPWWGPVLAPMCIALLMVVWGTRSRSTCSWPTRSTRSRTVSTPRDPCCRSRSIGRCSAPR